MIVKGSYYVVKMGSEFYSHLSRLLSVGGFFDKHPVFYRAIKSYPVDEPCIKIWLTLSLPQVIITGFCK